MNTVPAFLKSELPTEQNKAALLENVLIGGDLSKLTTEQRTSYYMRVCESVGLNNLTKPFEYITLNGKLVLYAKRDATDQLRYIHNVSVESVTSTEREGVYIVTAKVKDNVGRTDVSTGAVSIVNLKGNDLANALMKAETKAKRRATLSICGLGFVMDETEVETVRQDIRATDGELTPKQAYGSVKLMKEKFTEIAGKINGCNSYSEFEKIADDYKVDLKNFRKIDPTISDNLEQLADNRKRIINEGFDINDKIPSLSTKPTIDHDLENLKILAKTVAAGGSEALDKFLKDLKAEDKKKLVPFGAEIRKIADEVDSTIGETAP